MTDQLISAAAEALGGAPPELVRRSAAARARAQGVGIEEVLQAWSGGGSVTTGAAAEAPAAEAPVSAAGPEPAPAVPAGAAEAMAEPVAAEAPAFEPAPVAVAVVEAEPFEPAPLGARVGFAARLGAVIGLMLAIIFALGVSPLLLEGATVIGEDPLRPAVEMSLTWLIVVTAVGGAVLGVLVSFASRSVPGWFHPDMTMRGSLGAGWLTGAIVGAVGGAIGAPLAAGLVGETMETGVALAVRGGLIVLLAGSAALGALVSSAVQLLGEPARLPVEVEQESQEVRHRLAGGILIPLFALVAIAVLVLPFALLLLEFHGVAPLLAIVAAGGILFFAFLGAYRPGMRISAGEFVLAAVGIGILLLIIALVVLAQQEPGDHGEEVEALVGLVSGL